MCVFYGLCVNEKSPNLLKVKAFSVCFNCLGESAGVRTRDPNIKSVVLYLLSYGFSEYQCSRIWWCKDSNYFYSSKIVGRKLSFIPIFVAEMWVYYLIFIICGACLLAASVACAAVGCHLPRSSSSCVSAQTA